ncbi:ATP-binding protein [Galactobacillus timonensis]|uniref:ATP-binding protein n=1 Tax=Galactobacillus timonensis TaxID=2041840 RepID=UPI000C849DCC|nr:ATP-binding protein [Galactobacillus timonensis]
MSNDFCINALRQFKTVRYVKTSNILYEIEKADLNNQHLEYITSASQLDLLVLDDFGLMPLDPNVCRNLFELIDSREGRKSTIVISQLPLKDWFGIFKDNTYADACLDRLVSKAYRLEFNGKNMRNPNCYVMADVK